MPPWPSPPCWASAATFSCNGLPHGSSPGKWNEGEPEVFAEAEQNLEDHPGSFVAAGLPETRKLPESGLRLPAPAHDCYAGRNQCGSASETFLHAKTVMRYLIAWARDAPGRRSPGSRNMVEIRFLEEDARRGYRMVKDFGSTC
jgi:hypothetical protein